MRIATTMLALLVALPCLADGIPTYDEVSGKRVKLDGQTVRFTYRFTRVQGAVNPLLAARGISNKNHYEIKTPWRPAREGGSLIILGRRNNPTLLAACEKCKARQEVVFSGKIKHLTGDQGGTYYYLELSGVSAVPEKVPPKKDPTETTEPPKTGNGTRKYIKLEPAELGKSPMKYHGKRVTVTLKYGGPAKRAPAWALKLANLKATECKALRGTLRLSLLVPASSAKDVSVLKSLPPGKPVTLSGVLRSTQVGKSTLTVLVIEKAAK